MMKLSKLYPLSSAMFKCFLAVLLFVPFVSCGGGGPISSSSSGVLSLSKTTLHFATETPAVVPDYQTLTGEVHGKLSGTAMVYPTNASSLGAGTYTSKITIRACLNDAICSTRELSGSPKIVNVDYEDALPASS
jgi:hypothetical protein